MSLPYQIFVFKLTKVETLVFVIILNS